MIFSAIKRLKTIFEPNPPEATNYHLHLSGARLASKVQLRQLSVLKHRTTAVVAIRMLLYLIFTLTCWSYVGGRVMALWLAFNVMHTLASMKSADDFFNEPSMDKRFHYWKNRTLQMILVSGLSIGFAGFYFMVPDNVIAEMILLAMIVGVTFGSVPLYAIWLPALWIFVPATLLPTILKLVLIYQPSLFIALFWTLILFLIIFYFGVRLNKIYLQGIYRSFEREFLMEQLIFQRQKADYIREASEMAISARTRFFAAANHDLRQPLQAMGIFISILQGQADQQAKPLIDNLSKACNTVATLVDQILIISKLDSKTMKIRPTEVSIRSMFSELANEFTPMAEQKGLTFEVRAEPLMIVTDGLLFERVLRNLIGNAVRYTEHGGILLRAKKTKKNTLVVTVSDSDCGITKEDQAKLFQAYYRGGAGHKSREGFGLGLSIVDKICKLLNIELKLISKVGKGSIFRLEMAIETSVDMTEVQPPVQPNRIFSLENVNVLLIEDDPLIRESLATLLEGWGAKVRRAEYFDAELAAQLIEEAPVDIIFSDFNLGPGRLTGLQSIFRIRSVLGRKIPAIISTATSRDAIMAQYEEETEGLDFADSAVNLMELPLIVQKPVTPTEINRIIHREIEKK